MDFSRTETMSSQELDRIELLEREIARCDGSRLEATVIPGLVYVTP